MSKYYDYEYTTEGYTVEPCPFCGSSNTELYTDQVHCDRCEAQGPRITDWEKALAAWNEMPRPPKAKMKRLQAKWASRYRRQKQAEKIAATEAKKREYYSAEAISKRVDRQWALEREAWLRAPIGDDVNG